jgi:hypothetical protein
VRPSQSPWVREWDKTGAIGNLGCVAKIDERRQEPGLDLSLDGNSEEAVYESQLSPNIIFAYSVDLAFSDHVHRLDSFDRPPRRLETEEPKSGIDSAFDESMVLLDEVIEGFAAA